MNTCRPRWPGWRGRAGANRLASSRRRVIRRTWRRTAAISSRVAKLLSPTIVMRRSGSQRRVCRIAWIAWIAQRVSGLWRRPRLSLLRWDGARMVRNGSAPLTLRPRHRQHHHQRQPAQAAGLDEKAARGAHRIAVDAAGRDGRPPAPLDGVVDADHHLAGRQQAVEQMIEQPARQGVRIPAGLAQDFVEAAEARLVSQPHHPQGSADRALARRQHRAGDQDQHALPDRRGETVAERRQPGAQQGRHAGAAERNGVGTDAIGRHRIRRIERRPCRKPRRCFVHSRRRAVPGPPIT